MPAFIATLAMMSVVTGPPAPNSGGTVFGTGNELNNAITAEVAFSFINGKEGDDTLVAGRKAIMGALTLYLDFINLFTFLLQFMGNRE